MSTTSALPENERYTPEERNASGLFTPDTKYLMDVTKFRTLRHAGFGQAILDFAGRLSLGPYFVDPAPSGSN
jgi:hypothetical protein